MTKRIVNIRERTWQIQDLKEEEEEELAGRGHIKSGRIGMDLSVGIGPHIGDTTHSRRVSDK